MDEKVMGEDGMPKKVARYRKWMVFRSDSQRFSVSRPIEEACEASPLFESGNMKSRFLQRSKRVGPL